MSRRLASNFRDLFGGQSLHLIDHKRGKYPWEVLYDIPVFAADGDLVTCIPGRYKTPREDGWKEGYRTDLASIPTWVLKALLNPIKRRPWHGKEILDKDGKPRDWIIYVWVEDEDGTLVPESWFEDPIGYAAVLHDWGYSLELDPRAEVDGRFLEVLTAGEVWSRHAMYLAVRLGGWPSYPHPPGEVTEDRILAAEALDRWSAFQQTAMIFE